MEQTLHTTRLLIVDDDLVVRTVVAGVLRANGFEVVEADDGHSGLAQIEKCRPDLVLLDVMMPGMDGYEVCSALRARPETLHIPVIMLTGLNDTASIERAYESGATDFVTKPINPALLAYRVRYALRASHMLEEIDQHRAGLANAQRIARLGSWAWHPESGRLECSAEYQQVMGKDALGPDQQWRDILRHVHRDDSDRVAQAIEAAIGAGEAYEIVYRVLGRDGAERTIYEQTEVFHGADGRVVRIEGTSQDITERVAAEERIRQLADYDGLTGLANRKLFSEIINIKRKGKANDLVELTKLQVPLEQIANGPVQVNGERRDGAFPEATAALTDSLPQLSFFRAYTPELVGWFDGFSTSGTVDASGPLGRISTSFNQFSIGDSGLPDILSPIDPATILSGAGPVDVDDDARCPGSLERDPGDGSTPFTSGGEIDCNTDHVPQGP